jgi:UDP-N-acetylmuramoyl-tripeptide--D-alanyl-D-alanine ligase
MINLSVKWIANTVNAKLYLTKTADFINETYCNSVAIDSRTIEDKALFIAISGPNFDGHNFTKQAQEQGALVAIVEKIVPEVTIPQLIVPCCRSAIRDLAKAYRQLLNGKVIAVTGSSGKTSVKNMLKDICVQQGLTVATKGNLNNQLGLPLTLLNTPKNTEYIVLEMGTSYSGEIAILTDICKPDIAIITNAGHAHLEALHNVKNVAIEKANIISNSNFNATIILNKDDQYYDYWNSLVTKDAKNHNKKIISFSLANANANVYLESYNDTTTGTSFTAVIADNKIEANICVWGKHQLANVCCAIATSLAAGIRYPNIINGIKNISLASGRGKRYTLKNNSIVIDESYNANVESVMASIEQLASYRLTAPTIFVFADILELGNNAIEQHKKIGEFALQQGISQLLTIGKLAQKTCDVFGGKHFTTMNDLIDFLQQQLNQKVIILVKGSNKMDLNKVVEALLLKKIKGDTECYYG